MIPPGAAAGPRGASGFGEVPLPRARALATCLPSLHSSMGNRRRCRARGWRGWWQPAGVQAAVARRSTSSARPTACGSRPLAPTLGLLPASWALGRFTAATGRAEPGSRARELGCRMAAARVRPEPQSLLVVAGVLRGSEASEGAGMGLEGGYTQGVWIAP